MSTDGRIWASAEVCQSLCVSAALEPQKNPPATTPLPIPLRWLLEPLRRVLLQVLFFQMITANSPNRCKAFDFLQLTTVFPKFLGFTWSVLRSARLFSSDARPALNLR
jgi:hypothetical protein